MYFAHYQDILGIDYPCYKYIDTFITINMRFYLWVDNEVNKRCISISLTIQVDVHRSHFTQAYRHQEKQLVQATDKNKKANIGKDKDGQLSKDVENSPPTSKLP